MTKKTTLEELGGMLAQVVKHMPTKEDIADLKHELKGDIARVQGQVNSIETQLRHGRYELRLGNLEEKVFGAPRSISRLSRISLSAHVGRQFTR